MQETGIEPMPSGITPTLSMSHTRIFIRRNTRPDTGSRQSGSQRARTHGLAKERANKRNIFQLQARFSNFGCSVTPRHSHSTNQRAHSPHFDDVMTSARLPRRDADALAMMPLLARDRRTMAVFRDRKQGSVEGATLCGDLSRLLSGNNDLHGVEHPEPVRG